MRMVEALSGSERFMAFVLLGSGLIQLRWCLIWLRLPLHKVGEDNPSRHLAFSILIAARNEKVNLSKNMHSIMQQDAEDFEVIVANDRSWDRSIDFLEEFESAYPNLKIIDIHELTKHRYGKKFALSLAIKRAQHEALVLTDADCTPASPAWGKHMANALRANDLVLGYGPYTKSKGLINHFVRYETMFTAMNYLSRAISGKTYMGVGRNLAYLRTLWLNNKGFSSHLHRPSGDDDLFVQSAAKGAKVGVCIHPDAFVYSESPKSVHAWFNQKTRHMQGGQGYNSGTLTALMLQPLSQMLLLWMAVFWIVKASNAFYYGDYEAKWLHVGFAGFGVSLLLFRWAIQWATAYKLKERGLAFATPIYDLLLPFFQVIWAIASLFRREGWR